MLGKPFAHIAGRTDVSLIGLRQASNKVDRSHIGLSPKMKTRRRCPSPSRWSGFGELWRAPPFAKAPADKTAEALAKADGQGGS